MSKIVVGQPYVQSGYSEVYTKRGSLQVQREYTGEVNAVYSKRYDVADPSAIGYEFDAASGIGSLRVKYEGVGLDGTPPGVEVVWQLQKELAETTLAQSNLAKAVELVDPGAVRAIQLMADECADYISSHYSERLTKRSEYLEGLTSVNTKALFDLYLKGVESFQYDRPVLKKQLQMEKITRSDANTLMLDLYANTQKMFTWSLLTARELTIPGCYATALLAQGYNSGHWLKENATSDVNVIKGAVQLSVEYRYFKYYETSLYELAT